MGQGDWRSKVGLLAVPGVLCFHSAAPGRRERPTSVSLSVWNTQKHFKGWLEMFPQQQPRPQETILEAAEDCCISHWLQQEEEIERKLPVDKNN
ncbi:hypothetical protein EYF80_024093 [Liparis tanakae]|uniref:Uncharacterized protein n=1 Tax=Liparis tanakae TaxID=230148 RepID=A0A4Z2HIE4_9TELE|nr:hypothetical protein EYF80_024093 [Liparis tanakae]